MQMVGQPRAKIELQVMVLEHINLGIAKRKVMCKG
jgi:hypothetical protein